MAINSIEAKTIDDLREVGKLYGTEKTIISDGTETKKVSIDTIVGYTARMLNGTPIASSLPGQTSNTGSGIVFIPEGESIPVNERTPGCFYLEEKNQTSIRTEINIPTSVIVSKSLGLRRV